MMGGEVHDFTWEEWAGPLDSAAVTPMGRPVLSWAVDVLRDLFGVSRPEPSGQWPH
jgi:hypothetical protein